MSQYSREKGKRGEREIVKYFKQLAEEYGFMDPKYIKRNTLQSDSGGYDIANLPGLAVEVKRHERLNVKGWWKQCVKQAKKDETPILFYRQNRHPWNVVFEERGVLVTTTLERAKDFIVSKIR